jgi:hypothetical protein
MFISAGLFTEGLRQVPVTRCPSFMRREAMAAPIPEDAPVRDLGLNEEQSYLAMQRQKRRPIKEIAEAIVLSDEVRGNSQVKRIIRERRACDATSKPNSLR